MGIRDFINNEGQVIILNFSRIFYLQQACQKTKLDFNIFGSKVGWFNWDPMSKYADEYWWMK